MFVEEDLHQMTNEQISLTIKELVEEQERRKKVDKRVAAINFRDALINFLKVDADDDFHVTMALTTSDVDVCFEFDSEANESDIDVVEFDPFNREILCTILDELTRKIGNYEG